MSRRSNLNTVRKEFSWGSDWAINTNTQKYTELVLLDIKINEYLIGMFYATKMASSIYVIRRFLDGMVMIETDIFVLDISRMAYFSKNNFWAIFLLHRIKFWIFMRRHKINRRQAIIYLDTFGNIISKQARPHFSLKKYRKKTKTHFVATFSCIENSFSYYRQFEYFNYLIYHLYSDRYKKLQLYHYIMYYRYLHA